MLFRIYNQNNFLLYGKSILTFQNGEIMYVFIWLINIILFLFLLSFSAKNSEITTIHYYFDLEWQAPVVVILLIFFALGISLGYLFGIIKKSRRKL